MNFRFDYSKTILMKLDIGIPDNRGGCRLFNTFAQALEKIRIADALTAHAPKIVYLVGWQYQGHDDKYPAFFEVNEAAKRPQDKTARDSLLWLMEEAKKYHTTVSLHINLSDAYPDSPLWEEYLRNDLILKNARGKPKVTGKWNDRTAYQVRFAAEYKSGYFQKRVDRLLELLPIAETGTIHVDAFFVRRGRATAIPEEKRYRRKMIAYFMQKGIDVTSEFIYRERNCGLRLHTGESDIIGLIPAIWNLRMTQKDYLRYPPQLLAGGRLNMDLQRDKGLQYLFYGNTHGEPCFNLPPEEWQAAFTKSFALGAVPYLFLNGHKLQKITGRGKKRTAFFADGVQTAIRSKTIRQNSRMFKEDETLCLPIHWQEGAWYAYSSTRCEQSFDLPASEIEISRICENGLERTERKTAENGRFRLCFDGKSGYLIHVLS